MRGASSNFFKFFIISFILKMYFYVIFKTLKIYILVGKPVRKNEFSESCFSGSCKTNNNFYYKIQNILKKNLKIR